ncbi:MAG: hypothetical protein E7108_01845 [Bacteroidales bacterium]|nr:hypothetical protein [Bacteroidales bacterium]
MKVGIIRETRADENRTPITPVDARMIKAAYGVDVVVQKSQRRIFSDSDYEDCGIKAVNSLEDCDVLFGVKEPSPASLLDGKHYFFFGHMDQKPPYDKELLKSCLEHRITLTDYEYIVDAKGKRLVAFGYYAGMAGMYNTIRLVGLKYGLFELPALNFRFTQKRIFEELQKVRRIVLDMGLHILLTGKGNVSRGVEYILSLLGVEEVGVSDYLYGEKLKFQSVYCNVGAKELVFDTYGNYYNRERFKASPVTFSSKFYPFATKTDVLVCGHTFSHDAPAYLDGRIVRSAENRIRVVGDITCDIGGSVATTLRYSNHENPFYDVDKSLEEVELFADKDNISVMAVDTLPNALSEEASVWFSGVVYKYIFPELMAKKSEMLDRSTQIRGGCVTEKFGFLKDWRL